MSEPVTPTSTPAVSPGARRRAVSSAAIGQFIEFYDFIAYAYAATTIAGLFFPEEDRVAALLATFAVYATGFVMRPVGGLLFGHLGDRIGRRTVLAAIILLMGGSTLLIGLLPTYAQIGLFAPVLLTVARLLQGLSVGGEAIGSNTLVAEFAPKKRRATLVAFAYSFGVIPAVVVALFFLALNTALDPQAFEAWGWRVPFLLGGVIAVFGIYIRNRLRESPTFEETRASSRLTRAPIGLVFKQYRRMLGFGFVVCMLSGLGFYSLTGYFPTYLTEAGGLSSSGSLIANSVAMTVTCVAMSLGGMLADRIGRRPTLLIGAGGTAVLAVPGYALASAGSVIAALIGQSLLGLALAIFFGGFGAALIELFPTRVRFSGAATAINAAYIVFGGTAPLFSTWLIRLTGSPLAPAVYVAIVAVVVFVVSLRFPETRDASMVHETDTSTAPRAGQDLAADAARPEGAT